MPIIIFILFVALLPVVVLLYYIYKKDRYQREPASQMLLAFVCGIGATFLSLAFTMPFSVAGVDASAGQSVFGAIARAFYLAALPEETAKLIILWFFLRSCSYFDEHMDGIVYAVCVSLGFAALENVVYLFANYPDIIGVGISRSLFAVPGHFFFGVLMGYYYSLAKYSKVDKLYYMILTLLAPVLAHGCYDSLLFVMTVSPSLSIILTILFLYFCHKLRKYCSSKIEEHLNRDRVRNYKQKHSEVDGIDK